MDIDGKSNPDTVVMHAGRRARLRFITLALLNPNANVILTARQGRFRVLLRDSLTVNWLPLAKDARGPECPRARTWRTVVAEAECPRVAPRDGLAPSRVALGQPGSLLSLGD